MTNCFHLAIPAGNIKTALKFYCDILGCKTGNQEEGRWIDINFWGNELQNEAQELFPYLRHVSLLEV